MAPPSGGTTSVQVAVRIRPTNNHDTLTIPARFQRTVIQAATATSVQVDSTQSAPNATGSNASGQGTASSAGPNKKQLYTFDQVHPPSTSQHSLFKATAEPLISHFLQGFNCTILAYGQTSSGKTYSMTGVDLDAEPSDPNNGMGIIPRSVSNIFQRVRHTKEERGAGWSCSIKGSFIEIYNEDLIDLLGDESVKREVQIREDKDGHIIWGGLREVTVRSAAEVMNLIKQGTSIRRTNETDMNAQSSRSHAIFSLTLIQKKYTGSGPPPRSSSPLPPTGRSPSRLARPGSVYTSGATPRVSSPTFGRPPTPSFHSAMGRGGGGLRPSSAMAGRISPAPGKDEDDIGEWVTIVSKFHFVDLAGSERLKRTAAAGERIKEGISINSGLLALGNVISALGDPSRAKSHTASHIPYRDSKLTRLLQDSLGGNAHTLMIACVSPAEWNVGETINTLKYANRARNIRNRAVVNEKEDGWDDIEWLQNMVTRLRKEVKAIKEGTSVDNIPSRPESDTTGRAIMEQFDNLQSQHDQLRQQFTQRTEELTRLRRELGETHRSNGGIIPGTGKYEEIVGPVIEEYEKTISNLEAELSLNHVALRHTNNLVTDKEEELATVTERHAATELYLEELRARVVKLSDREASTEAYVRDLEEKIKLYDESNISSSSSVSDLKREIQQYKDAESHAAAYIADLEHRLGRSDESILSLRDRVQRLENDVEDRVQATELLQRRLNELTADGQAWRSDLEQREARLKELEKQLEAWEERKRSVGEERERLGDVAVDVAKARRSLEVDMRSPLQPAQDVNNDLSVTDQLLALQQTHQATLADLSAITDKYRDALREIADLASQIQEAKLQATATLEPSSDSSESVIPPTPRRRLTVGGSLRSPRSPEVGQSQINGSSRRLFFRQAASTESLHARSLSQSQSLSQELSSARSPRPSLNGRPDSLHLPSPSLLSPPLPRPTLSVQTPVADSPNGERSPASLEKEIMRLQEVLKEREAEINALEQSLRERPERPVVSQDMTSITEADDGENEADDNKFKELSPKTLKQFKDLRRLSRRLSLQKAAEPTADASETMDRLNELMLSMAQKESHHREDVDRLNTELNQIRRQHDELSALSRDQALNMSTELEALRKDHVTAVSELEELHLKYTETSTELENQHVSQANLKAGLEDLREREQALLDKLQLAERNHIAEVERLRHEHEQALKVKGAELDALLEDVQNKHDEELAKCRAEIADAAAILSRTQQQHEEAFGRLRTDHSLELEKRGKDVEAFLGQSQTEQAESLSKLQSEHAQSLRQEIEQSHCRMQELRDEHASAIDRLQSAHTEILSRKDADSNKALDRLRQDHVEELTSLKLAKEISLKELQVQHNTTIQALKDEHEDMLISKEKTYRGSLSALKEEHDNVRMELEQLHIKTLEHAVSEHSSALAKVMEDKEMEATQLEEQLKNIRGDHAAAVFQHEQELKAAMEAAKEAHTTVLQDIEKTHQMVLQDLTAEHETSLAKSKATQEEEHETLLKSFTEEILKLKTDHKTALADVNNALIVAQIQHQKDLEEITGRHEAVLLEVNEKHAVALKDIATTQAQEREALIKDHELLEQEVAAYKSAMDEFTVTREQTREAHEEAMVKKDLLIASMEEELAITKKHNFDSAAMVKTLRAELEDTRNQTTELVREASKRESLVHDLERHRSLLGEVQINLQKTRDERDNLAAEKNRQEDVLRQLQAQLETQSLHKAAETNVVAPRPILEHRSGSLSRTNGLPPAKAPPSTAPPMTPPPAGPPPPTPAQLPRIMSEAGASRSSAAMSVSSRASQMDTSTPATSMSPTSNGHISTDQKTLGKLEEQTRLLEEKETMIKTLNKQLTHCEGDLQAHMDLVSTLETQLNDSERNLRKARMQATEFSKERDRLSGQVESLRNELQEAKREVVTVRRSVVEEKQSLEYRLDEERKAKERARAQLDSRMEELQKRKSKFACM